MSREEFESIGGTITMVRRDPQETRWLAELPHDGTTIRRRGPSPRVAIEGVIAAREAMTDAVQVEREKIRAAARPGGDRP